MFFNVVIAAKSYRKLLEFEKKIYIKIMISSCLSKWMFFMIFGKWPKNSIIQIFARAKYTVYPDFQKMTTQENLNS